MCVCVWESQHPPSCVLPGWVYSCLQAFSIQRSSQGVLSWTGTRASYSSLNGVRILSLLWIICGHTIQLSAWNNLGMP